MAMLPDTDGLIDLETRNWSSPAAPLYKSAGFRFPEVRRQLQSVLDTGNRPEKVMMGDRSEGVIVHVQSQR